MICGISYAHPPCHQIYAGSAAPKNAGIKKTSATSVNTRIQVPPTGRRLKQTLSHKALCIYNIF